MRTTFHDILIATILTPCIFVSKKSLPLQNAFLFHVK